MNRLDGKVAFITGAGSGIGRTAALLFAREGAKVAVAEFSTSSGEETVQLIEEQGGEAVFLKTDVTEPESVAAGLSQTVAKFGKLNVLYNNAGGTSPDDGSVTEAPLEGFWAAIRVDLFGTWLGCRYGIPYLIEAGGGSIINTGSMAGVVGIPPFHGYAAAKGGVIAMTRSIAAEYGPKNIRVNAIAPGMTATEKLKAGLASGRLPKHIVDRHLLGLVEPIEIANMALFLASDESRPITGQTIRIDSGASISLGEGRASG